MAQPNHSNLYIQNLSPDVEELTLRQVFEGYGQIASMRLIRNNRIPNGFGVAFVRMATVDEATNAVNGLNGAMFGAAQIAVSFAHQDAGNPKPSREIPACDNIYIKGLPLTYSDQDLLNLVVPYGQVQSYRLLSNPAFDSAEPYKAALVRMASVDQATAAVQALNGKVLTGSTMALLAKYAENRAGHPGGREGGGGSGGKASRSSHSSRYAPYSLPASQGPPPGLDMGQMGQLMSGQQAAAFGQFTGMSQPGLMAAAGGQQFATGQLMAGTQYQGSLPGMASQQMMTLGGQGQNGIYQMDLTAMAAQGGMMLPGLQQQGLGQQMLPLQMQPGMQMQMPQQQQQQMPSPQQPSAPAASLCVKNLPAEIDDLWLYKQFAPFGAVNSVKTMQDDQGQCRGLAFVNYKNNSDAGQAQQHLHNMTVGDKTVTITFQMPRRR